jgi:limonene 1,2-monooxygenase
VHIAETKEQAVADVAFGLEQWVDYFQRVAALPLAPNTADFDTLVDALIGSGWFGTFLLMGHEWADTAATRRSYELFARYVAPQFQDASRTLTASRDWAAENRPEFIGAAGNAVLSAIQQHHDEKAAKASNA